MDLKMDLLHKTVLLFAALLTLSAGSFPPGTVICQAIDGELIIESSCNCDSEVPPCCEEDECHEEQEIGAADQCIDTLISLEHYTEQDTAVITKSVTRVSFSDYIF